MEFEYKNVLVMGYGKSGQAVVNLLNFLEVNYKVYDKKKLPNVDYNKLSKKIIKSFDLIVLSPGISIYNKYVNIAKKLGIMVISELEFGYYFTKSKIIAITGTNGKTTTTGLVNEMVSKKYISDVFGNIGNPLTNATVKSYDYLVCEVSSFQLEGIKTFKPNISVILNLAEDHLDRHKSMDNYVSCKLSMLKNNTEKSITVLNADDNLLMANSCNIKGNIYFFSKYDKVAGVYIKDGNIVSNINGVEDEIVSLDDLSNLNIAVDNILASILVALLTGIDKKDIIEGLLNFKVSSHRLEVVYENNNIKYINDSKSTNIHSTIHAIEETKGDIVLLLGGKNKKLSFDNIFNEYLHNLKSVVAFGSARKEILKSAKKYNFENVVICKKFHEAVKQACSITKEGSTVLLSPGCSSLDEFNNYKERGDAFTRIVKEYNNVKE